MKMFCPMNNRLGIMLRNIKKVKEFYKSISSIELNTACVARLYPCDWMQCHTTIEKSRCMKLVEQETF